MLFRILGFGIIFFCTGFVLYVAFRPMIEKMPWYRKLKVMLLPNDFKEDEKILEVVNEELESIKPKKKLKVLKNEVGGEKTNGTRNRREEGKARKFYGGKSRSDKKHLRRTCELTNK